MSAEAPPAEPAPPAGPDRLPWRAVFEQALSPMLLADDAGRYIAANRAACEMLGHDHAEILAMSVADLALADESPSPTEQWTRFRADGSSRGQLSLRRRDGSVVVVEFAATTDVAPGVHLSVLLDVTERVERERQTRLALAEANARLADLAGSLQLALGLAGLGVARESAGGTRLALDEGACRILGLPYPAASPATPEELLAWVLPEDRERAAAHRAMASGGGAAEAVEVRMRTATGQVRDVRVQWAAEGDHAPWHRDRVGVMLDVTEQRRAEAASAAQRAAEQANRAKSEFLARMSHELRTPLNAIVGFADVLLHNDRVPLDAEAAEQVGYIQRAGEHLRRLIGDLLDISRLEAGRLPLPPRPVDLVALLGSVLADAGPSAHAGAVRLRGPDAGTAATVLAEPQRLRQALGNVVQHAVRHAPAGSELRCSIGPAADGVELALLATGAAPGVDDWLRALEPFTGVATAEDRGRDLGLALPIARRLVLAMGGRFGVEPEGAPGVGCRIRIVLPAPPA
jgi:PAS domain S-box-containing protein